MYEIQQQKEHSADVDQTANPDRTDSENSDEFQEAPKKTELGLVNEPPANEDQEEQAKDD